MGARSTFIKAYRVDAWHAQKGCCIYCYQPLTRDEVTADHRRARATGGLDSRDNIVAACAACNSAKGSMSDAVFLAAITAPTTRHFPTIWLCWSRRSINAALHRSHRRLMKACGGDYHGPRIPTTKKTRKAA